ncbi:MAG TPA: glutathione peroxidase [Bryobacteraceae bacterium]
MAAPTFAASSIYDFTVNSLTGTPVPLSSYSGKVVLVVNVASKCGFTPQYEGLEKLYEKYKDRGLVILGFPANNFMHQEPGTNEEIGAFCKSKYGVTFPMFSKISVKGDDKAPLYQYLTSSNGKEIPWNFTKFLVGKDGKPIERFDPKVTPDSSELTTAIEKALGN